VETGQNKNKLKEFVPGDGGGLDATRILKAASFLAGAEELARDGKNQKSFFELLQKHDEFFAKRLQKRKQDVNSSAPA